MATAKTTTRKKTTDTKKPALRKAQASKTEKPKLSVVRDEPARELSVFEKLAVSYMPETATVDLGNGMTVNVRNRIGLGEMMMLVHSIVDTCTDEEKGIVHFELLDYVAKASICSVYCNEPLPENNEIAYLATVGVGRMYDLTSQHMDTEQLENIMMSAKAGLQAKSDLFAGAAAKITVDMLQRINALYDMLGSLSDEFSGQEVAEALRQLSTLASGK